MDDQPLSLGRNGDDRSSSPKRKKVRQKYAPKACVSCRRSKLKCSGDNPCQRCRDNGKRCFYSEDQTAAEALQNLSRPTLSQQPSTLTSVSNGSGLGRRNIMPRHQANEPRNSGASVLGLSMEARMARVEAMMEALLQDRTLTMIPSGSVERDESGSDVAMPMPILDPINPALALMGQSPPAGRPPDDSVSTIDPLLSTDTTVLRVGNRSFIFPTTVVYDSYINTFFGELQSFHPCIDEHTFRMRSSHMLAKREVPSDDVCFLGLNYIIFAWQDISTEVEFSSNGTSPGWHWLQLADEVLGTRQLHAQGDQSLAQFLLFKALYYCLTDQPSLAYTTIGLACRYVFHHGLNRQSSYTQPNPAEKFNRLRTFWNILITDRRISLSCGRPYSIRDLDVDVQRPSHIFEHDVNLNNTHFAHVTEKTKSDNGFLDCMIHWSRFAGSLWDSIFAVTASQNINLEKLSTFDAAVMDFFEETYPTIFLNPRETRQIQFIHLSFNNLRLLARRQIMLSLQFDGGTGHVSSELVLNTIARVREYKQASEPPPYTFRHYMISPLASSLVVLCSLLVRDLSSPDLGLDVCAPTYISNFGIAVAMLHDLADHFPLAQRVLVDFDKIVDIVQATNALWSVHEFTLEPAHRWNKVRSVIPPNVADLFPYRDRIPVMQTTRIAHEFQTSGVPFGGTAEDRSDPWVVDLNSEEVGRGVLWV